MSKSIYIDLILTNSRSKKNMEYRGTFDELYLSILNMDDVEFYDQDGYSILIPAKDIRFATVSKEEHDTDDGTDQKLDEQLDKDAPKGRIDGIMKQQMMDQERDSLTKKIDEIIRSNQKAEEKAAPEKKPGSGTAYLKDEKKKEDDDSDILSTLRLVNYSKYQLRRYLSHLAGFSAPTIAALSDKYAYAVLYVATEIEGDFMKWGIYNPTADYIADVCAAAAEVFSFIMNHDGDTSMSMESIMMSIGQEYYDDKFAVKKA